MTDVLDVVGLLALVVGAFLVWFPLGFLVFGGGCLWVSWSATSKKRKAAEAELANRARVTS